MTLIARTAGDPVPLVEPLRREVADARRGIAVLRGVTLEAHLAEASTTDRLTTTLVGACGAVALLLAMIGVYGVMAYSVVRRTREISLRVALGAGPAQIVRLVFTEGVKLTAVGTLVGLAAAFLGADALGSMVYGVTTSDAIAFAAAPAALALMAVAAAILPVRRALRNDPVTVLRQE